MNGAGWNEQEKRLLGNKQPTLKLCGDYCRIVLSGLLLFFDKEGSHLVFVYPWTPSLSARILQMPELQAGVTMPSCFLCFGALMALWTTRSCNILVCKSSVCTGDSCMFAWEIHLQKRTSKWGLLKPWATTGGFCLQVGQSLLKTRKGSWWGRNPVTHFASLWSSRNKLQVPLFFNKMSERSKCYLQVTLEFQVSATDNCDWRQLLARMETRSRSHPVPEKWGLVGCSIRVRWKMGIPLIFSTIDISNQKDTQGQAFMGVGYSWAVVNRTQVLAPNLVSVFKSCTSSNPSLNHCLNRASYSRSWAQTVSIDRCKPQRSI